MKIMGLDVGDKTIGIAISDLSHTIAQGRETLFRTSTKNDIDYLIDMIEEEQIGVVVSGLPKNMNGTLGPQGEKTISFIKKLEKKIKYSDRLTNHDIEIVYWDERLTSVSATKMLVEANVSRKKRKQVIDKVAATFILQGYLDSIKKGEK